MPRLDLALEQKIIRRLKHLRQPPSRLLVAVSGGLDSMVLAHILHKWRRGLKLQIAVAHVHHGASDSKRLEKFRRQAQAFVRGWAEAHQVPFFTNDHFPPSPLLNEQDFREWRLHWLNVWRQDQGFDAVAFAHHQDDLLETRLLRLIRGSGGQGLRAMRFQNSRHKTLRPLLLASRAELETYAKLVRLNWIEDPSNAETSAFRNWLRHEWLPALEAKRPGAKEALSRSLELLAPKSSVSLRWPVDHVGVRREFLRQLPREQQRESMAAYLKSLGLRGYQRTHVDELLKRLTAPKFKDQELVEFPMLGCIFHFTPDLVWASRV